MSDAKFDLEDEIRYESGVIGGSSAASILECAGECAVIKCCCAFNFGSSQCELLSVTASARTNASGWTHGHTGKI